MVVNEYNITDLQDKLWYVIKCEEDNTGVQNLNTNNTNEFVNKLIKFSILLK
jgi:hypothetical protein